MQEESMTSITPEGGMDSTQPTSEAPAAEGSVPTPMDAAPQMPASDDPNKIVITEEETKPTEIVPDSTNETPTPVMDSATVSPAVDPAPWSPGAIPMGAEQTVQSSESVASTPEASKEMSTADAIITLAKAANLSPDDTKKIAEELSK